MSLVAYAIRIATVYALRGATLAGAEVFDAPLDPLEASTGSSTPLIAVYCGHEKVRPGSQPRDLITAERELMLTIQTFLPVSVAIDGVGTVDARQAGSGLVLDALWRQIEIALLESQGPWAVLWRTFVSAIHEVVTTPYLIQNSGQDPSRIAADETQMTLETLAEPAFGAAPTVMWADLITAMEGEPEVAGFAPFFSSLISNPTLLDWQQAQTMLGANRDEADALGITPVLDSPTDPALGEIDVTDTVSGETVAVTPGMAEPGIEPGEPPVYLP